MNAKFVFVFVAAVAATSAASSMEDVQNLFLQVQNGAGRKHVENGQIRDVIDKMKKELDAQHSAALAQLQQHEEDRDAVITKFKALKDKKAEDLAQFNFDFASHSKTITEELALLQKLTTYVETTLKNSFDLDGSHKAGRTSVVRGDEKGTTKIGDSAKLSATKTASDAAIVAKAAAITARKNAEELKKQALANGESKAATDAAAEAKTAADAAADAATKAAGAAEKEAADAKMSSSTGQKPPKSGNAALLALIQQQVKGQHRRLLGKDITSLLEVADKVSKLDMSNSSDKADYMKLFSILKKFKQKLMNEKKRWTTLKENQLASQRTVDDEADAQILQAKKSFMQFVQRQVLEEEDRNKQVNMLDHILKLVLEIEGVKTTLTNTKTKQTSEISDYTKSEEERERVNAARIKDQGDKVAKAKKDAADHATKNAATVAGAHRQGGKLAPTEDE